MMIDVRRKKAERNTTNSKKHDLTAKREHVASERRLTEYELIQIVGGDDPGDPPPYIGQQHNEHHLRWNKAGRDRTDSQKREPKLKRERKPGKQHLTERELSQVVGADDPGDPPPPYSSQQHNEHYLRWKKDRRDSKKRLLKRSKPH